MASEPESPFSKEAIDICINLVEQKFPEIWKSLEDHELGRHTLGRDAYGELWRPIKTLIFNKGFSQGSVTKLADLTLQMRFEHRRRLGL